MSGHSKWSKIKHQKAATDSKKGKMFSQLAKQIALAVRGGGSGDPNQNAKLRMVLDKARQANLPKENIQRAIEKGLGKVAGASLSEIVVEGYGPNGIAIMAAAATDNQNRTKSELRTIFDRHGGSIGEPGSVAYIFSAGAPSYTIPLAGAEAEKVRNLIESVEEHEDVEQVKHNAQFN